MLKKNEPDWIEHHLSPVCPVPAGHDVEVEYNWGKTYRCDNPELRDWTRVTHYRDWTAFEQQQASAGEVPKLLTEAEWRELLSTAWVDPDEKLPELRERGLIAPEPEPDALREVAEELARESQDLNLPLRKRVDWFEAQLRARGVTAPARGEGI